MPLFLIRMTLTRLSFRIPSLLSIADLYGFQIRFVSEDLSRSVFVVELEKEEHAQLLLERGILVLWIAQLFASGDSHKALQDELESKLTEFDPFRDSVFKITVEAVNLHVSGSYMNNIACSFEYLDLKGKINLSKPDVEFLVFEDYELVPGHTKEAQRKREGLFKQVYFARRIGYTRARYLVNAHAIKTREYYGNTSMESEMGFLMALQTLAAPGKIIYDPCVGTGSLLYACAQFGAYVVGSDIDGRQMRGKKKGKGIPTGMDRAAMQYGTLDKLFGGLTFDLTKNAWRRGGWLDAIVTDPPYGVRAGAKRLGKKLDSVRPMREEPYQREDGSFAHLESSYLPPSRPYELTHLTLDLIRLARYMLVPGGRLVFFLPTITEEYDAIDIPIVEGMKELKWEEGSVQEFGPWGRRLITMVKTAQDDGPTPTFTDYSILEGKSAGHKDFNKRYAKGFNKKKVDGESVANEQDAEEQVAEEQAQVRE